MKKILLSLAMVLAIGGGVIGMTTAFFSDTETSANNIFVAGSVDLKVDHTYASYLGEECDINCTPTGNDLIVNGGFEFPEPTANGGKWQVYPENPLNEVPGWDVVSGSGLEIQENGAVPGATAHSGDQLAELDSHSPGSPASAIEQIINTVPGAKYQLKFWHSPRPNNGPDTDNAVELDVLITSNSGVIANQTVGLPSFGATTNWTEHTINFVALDTETTIRFSDAGSQPDTLGGYLDDVSVYELLCDGPLYPYGGQCNLWSEKDLTDDTFWYFPDIKPGDWGRNIISLHVYDNDSYACLLPSMIDDRENTLLGLEEEAGDDVNVGNPSQYGELSDYLEFFAWADANANNQYDNGEEIFVEAGTPFNEIQTEMLAMNLQGNTPITLIGMEWCAGTQTGPTIALPGTALDCDGAGMTNIVQSDSMIADFVAYAVQQRNNEGFLCADADVQQFAEWPN